MEWVAIDVHIAGDAVVHRLAERFRLRIAEAAGLLTLTFAGMAQHAQDGELANITDSQLEAWATWNGKRGQFAAFIREHLCDERGTVRAWEEYNGRAIRRAEAAKERTRQWREKRDADRNTTPPDTSPPPHSTHNSTHTETHNSTHNVCRTGQDMTGPDLKATTSPPPTAAKRKAVPTWLTPYLAAWAARFDGGEMPIEPSVGPLRKLEKLHGAAETLRRWVIYLAATGGSYATAAKFASTWGDWSGDVKPIHAGNPALAEAAVLWERYKGANLLTRWQRPEYERIGAELVGHGLYPSVEAFLDELRVTQPWSLADSRTDGYAINALAQRLSAPRKVVA